MSIVITVSVVICDILYPNLYESFNSLLLPYVMGLGVAIFSGAMGIVMLVIHQKMLNQRKISSPTDDERRIFSFKYITSLPITYCY